MAGNFQSRKQLILAGVILLIGGDVALAGYSWKLASTPQTPKEEFAAQSKKLEFLRADIKRAQNIQAYMPHIQTDCDAFEKESLFPASSGYSSVTADLGTISKKAALQLSDLSFKQKENPIRKVTEVAIDATVTGDYINIVEFLNGLQRSKNVYAVESLSLASEVQSASSVLRVAIHMKTYFRTA